MKILLAGFSLLLAMTSVKADALRLTSGAQRTALLELYTSEGCSSCPPAESQLSHLKDSPGLWKQFVPIAYHVDYWNRLGWPDRYSSAAWTARQQRYASLWRSDSVYTPAFVLNGEEMRGGVGEVPASDKAAGVLSATSADGKTWKIDFEPAAKSPAEWEVHVAQLGAGITSHIGGGENGGRTLAHDFVVLAQQDAPLAAHDGHASASLTIATPSQTAPRRALAVWVTRRGELAAAQATGGWLAAR